MAIQSFILANWPILAFFAVHWQLSVFVQTFFLHRYGAHRMFTMSHGWERFFHLLTYVSQGSGYLSPRGYAILHRMHHAFSDTEKDPHSPIFHTNAMAMMLKTKHIYDGFAYGKVQPEPRFEGGYPEWDALDKLGQNWFARIGWGAAYVLFYMAFVQDMWLYALLPVHFILGPVHGAIVNWGGHKYGYRNYDDVPDVSVNSLPFDFLTGGELFQNNHHKFGASVNFAARKWELDPTYPVIRVLAAVGIITLKNEQKMRYPAPAQGASEAPTAAVA